MLLVLAPNPSSIAFDNTKESVRELVALPKFKSIMLAEVQVNHTVLLTFKSYTNTVPQHYQALSIL